VIVEEGSPESMLDGNVDGCIEVENEGAIEIIGGVKVEFELMDVGIDVRTVEGLSEEETTPEGADVETITSFVGILKYEVGLEVGSETR